MSRMAAGGARQALLMNASAGTASSRRLHRIGAA